MSGAWPTSPAFRAQAPASAQPTMISSAANGKRHVRQLSGHKWLLTASYPSMTRAEFAPIMAFVVAQRGQYESFTVVPPTIAVPQGDPVTGSTPLVDGASQTGRSLITDGWANSTLIFKAGDFFKLAGNDKVYMLTADATSDGSGDATLAFEPALVESPADGEALTVTSVPFTMSLAGGVQSFPMGLEGYFTFEVDFEEVLS